MKASISYDFPVSLHRPGTLILSYSSWSMTEFSVSIREMQEKCQMIEFQQRKCSIIFDLSSKLARVLEFCTCEIPQAFLSGADTNFCRLVELIVFVLNHLASVADPEFFDL
ncbi:hypothetical protein L2E82_39852 [Cichorium intybus]|uniref:Uncharacterized protein n=1 Tax=Cichorium intybus TaxID=13427 RepID=A0ACB9AKC4_CICIN|nr:hypothetical protein L2E82_39852 [Cichorium intybus]